MVVLAVATLRWTACVRPCAVSEARYLCYRRDEENMPGSRREVKTRGRRRRVQIQRPATGIEVNGNGKVSGVKMVRVPKWANPDAKAVAARRSLQVPEHIVPADAVTGGVWFPSTQHGMAGKTQRRAGFTKHHRPGRQRQRLPDQQPENLCWRRYRPWFRIWWYRYCRRSAADGIMNWLEV